MVNDLTNSISYQDTKTLAELRAALIISRDKKTDFNEEDYRELADKYAKAMAIIEEQRLIIEEYKKNKLPSKEEVDSISSMLDLISKLDDGTLEKISKLGK